MTSVKPESNFAFKKTWEEGRIAPVSRVQDWWAESIHKGIPVIPGLSESLSSQKVCESIINSSSSGIFSNI